MQRRGRAALQRRVKPQKKTGFSPRGRFSKHDDQPRERNHGPRVPILRALCEGACPERSRRGIPRPHPSEDLGSATTGKGTTSVAPQADHHDPTQHRGRAALKRRVKPPKKGSGLQPQCTFRIWEAPRPGRARLQSCRKPWWGNCRVQHRGRAALKRRVKPPKKGSGLQPQCAFRVWEAPRPGRPRLQSWHGATHIPVATPIGNADTTLPLYCSAAKQQRRNLSRDPQMHRSFLPIARD